MQLSSTSNTSVLNLLDILNQSLPFSLKAQKIIHLFAESTLCAQFVLMPIYEDEQFTGYVYQQDNEEEITSHLLEWVDRAVALNSNRVTVEFDSESGHFVLTHQLRIYQEPRIVIVLSKPIEWTKLEIEEFTLISKQLERELDFEQRSAADSLKNYWLSRFHETHNQDTTPTSQIDTVLRNIKGILDYQNAAIWQKQDQHAVPYYKETTSLFKDSASQSIRLAGSLFEKALEKPVHYASIKLSQEYDLCSDEFKPNSAFIHSFTSKGITYFLTLGAGTQRINPIKEEETWVVSHCVRWLSDYLYLFQIEQDKIIDSFNEYQVLDHSSDAVFSISSAGVILYLNQSAARLIGKDPAIAKGQPLRDLLQLYWPKTKTSVLSDIESLIANANTGQPIIKEAVAWGVDNSQSVVQLRVNALLSTEGKNIGIILNLKDVSEQHLIRQQIQYTKDYDTLTGLLNRDSLFELLHGALRSARFGHQHALIYMDLDHLKALNDTYGHSAGDALLKDVATLLQQQYAQRAVITRFGADEFVILVEYCPLEQGVKFATAVRDSIQKMNFLWQKQRFPVSASFGLTLIDQSRNSVEEIIADADAACFGAKLKGRNQVKVSQQEDLDAIAARRKEMEWALELNNALDESRLAISMQPLVCLDTHTITGYEALLRLKMPNGQEVSPGIFMDIAERYNIAPKLDRWVCQILLGNPEKTFNTLKNIDSQTVQNPQLNINLSGSTISDVSFLPFVQKLAKNLGTFTQQVCFEVTETSAVKSLASAAGFLQELKKLGFKIALDDFGAGMSSFSYLKHFPVDIIKIDGNIVRTVHENKIDYVIVSTITHACTQLGILVVAESIETEQIASIVVTARVPWGQGYHLGYPKPFEI